MSFVLRVHKLHAVLSECRASREPFGTRPSQDSCRALGGEELAAAVQGAAAPQASGGSVLVFQPHGLLGLSWESINASDGSVRLGIALSTLGKHD